MHEEKSQAKRHWHMTGLGYGTVLAVVMALVLLAAWWLGT